MSDIDHVLDRTTRAAGQLREQLQLIAGDDLDLFHDMIEGEFDFEGIINAAAEQNLLDAAQVNAVKEMENKLAERRDRYEKRIALRRVAILAAMQTAELHKIETPAGTISRKAVPPAALILEEDKIPAEFWKPQDPKLDKKAVLDALKAGTAVPGCQLSNGGETIQIRL